jgi:hypothetical protein
MRPRHALATLALLTAAALGATITPASASDAPQTATTAHQDPVWGVPSPDDIIEAVTEALFDPIWG